MAQLKDLIVNGKSKFIGGTEGISTMNSYTTGANDTNGRWTVTIPGITQLYDGLCIRVKLAKTYNSDYNTLDVNSLGAKLVWYRRGSRLTSHIPQYSEATLTYRTDAGSYTTGGVTYTDGWILDVAYYENSGIYVRYDPKAFKVGDTAIPAYNPIGEDKDGLLVPMLSKPFLVSGPMYIYASDMLANVTGSWASLYDIHYDRQIRNGANYVEGVAYKPLYLKGTISDGMFTTDTTTPYVTSLPSTEDGFCYYYLGETTTTTASSKYTYIAFRTGVHPVYVYKNGAIQEYEQTTTTALSVTNATNTAGCTMVYDATDECVKFNFS